MASPPLNTEKTTQDMCNNFRLNTSLHIYDNGAVISQR